MSADSSSSHLEDGEHLAVLGYEDSFNRSMTLWANFALGFTYLSPLVGVYSLFAVAMATVKNHFLTRAPHAVNQFAAAGEDPAVENVVLLASRELGFVSLQAHDVQ